MAELQHCSSCGALLGPAVEVATGLCARCLLPAGISTVPAVPADDGTDLSPILQQPASPLAVKFHRFGDYELVEEIARGGMGVVFKARQVSLNRMVAVKLIQAGRLATTEAVRRFELEAEAAARLDHPNIVPIYEVGEYQGHRYFSMKLVNGGALGNRALHLPATTATRSAARLLATIARAVHYAHQRGILHRDLKPANILLDVQGQPHIMDFGLAKLLTGDTHLTQPNLVMGTPAYLSPEQAAGRSRDLTTAGDLWSLGAILYELLTGRPPFSGSSTMEILKRVSEDDPAPPSALNREVDRDLETICLKCLEKEPGHRYSTAEALAEELTRWLQGEPILARPVTPWERARKWARRHPATSALAGAVGVSLLLGLAGTTWQWRAAERERVATGTAHLRLQLQRVEEFFASDRPHLALATLARSLRDHPAHRATQERLVNALRFRVLLVPTGDLPQRAEASAFGLALDVQSAPRVVQHARLTATATNGPAVILVSSGPAPFSTRLPLPKPGVIRALAVDPGAHWLAAATDEGAACVWALGTGELAATLEHPAAIHGLDFNPSGTLLATGGADGVVRLWNVPGFTNVGLIQAHRGAINAVRFCPWAPFLVSGGTDGLVRAWNSETRQPHGDPAAVRRPIDDLRFRRDSLRLFIRCGQATWTGWRWSVPQATQHTTPPLTPPPSLEPIVAVRGRPAPTFHAAEITFMEVSPDGRRFVTASADFTARIWDPISGAPTTEPLLHTAVVNGARFSPDSLRVVTSTADRQLRVWDVETGTPLTDWLRVDQTVTSAGFSSDGARVVASTGDAWEIQLATGRPAPDWLPDLAEAIAGVRVNPSGVQEEVPPIQAAEICRRIAERNERGTDAGWLVALLLRP